MKKFILACFILVPVVCFANSWEKQNRKAQCVNRCSSELGICQGGCNGDAECISRCQNAYSRCLAGCNQ